tara:strand:- start:344 stop:898 length:555 start_codon:yes stop_codon:yes gene_type:complete
MIISLPFKGKVKIITGEIPDFQNIQQALIDSIDASPDVQKHKTNLKCKMTDWRVHETNTNFAKICGHVKAHVEQYQKKAYKSNNKITVTECWGAHYTEYDKAIKHTHYPALWSGVAYIKCADTCSPTLFSECDYAYKPKEGTYIIFPGWLKHEVQPGSDSRYICAFNMRALNIKNGRHQKESSD